MDAKPNTARHTAAGHMVGINQADPTPGLVELGPGYLDPSLLPTDLMRRCVARAVRRWGPQTLGYGANAGPRALREWLAHRVGGGWLGDTPNVATTSGTSSALDQIAMELARQGRILLTESLTYDLGCAIFSGRSVMTRPVPGPADDIDVDAVRRAAVRAARTTGQPPALYLMSTFHNPTSRVLGPQRRAEIAALAEQLGLLVIDDLAYSELSLDSPPPPPLWTYPSDPDRMVGLYSFSKSLAPGLRMGWLVGGRRWVDLVAADPARRSGGGPNHFTAMAITVACLDGDVDRRLRWLRGQLRLRRDTLLAGLSGLPDGYQVVAPAGGYFVWVQLPPGVADLRLLAMAQQRGVSFAPGRRFGSGARGIRLCFAAAPPAELQRGALRLVAAALTLASQPSA